MTRPMFFGADPHRMRQRFWDTVAVAEQMLASEDELVERLRVIDAQRLHVNFGFRSLRTFCTSALRLSKTQSQRIVTRVRQDGDVARDTSS